MSRREMEKLLSMNGYHLVRIRGSHFIWGNSKGNRITITKDLNKMVGRRLIKENNLVLR